MSSRLLDLVDASSSSDLVHPRELGGKLKAEARNHDEAQAVWWSRLSNCTRVAERQMPGARRGEYGLLLQVWQTRSGTRFMVVVDEPGQPPIQFWAIPQPAPVAEPAEAVEAPKAAQPAPYVWPVNVIREAQDVAPVAAPAPSVAPKAAPPVAQSTANSEWRFYLVR